MTRSVEIEGDSVEKAVEAALTELGVSEDDARVDVLEEGEAKAGFLGLKRSGHARVRVTIVADGLEILKDTSQRVLELMDLDGDVSVEHREDGSLHVDMAGESDDLGILIGRHGQTLEALQTVLGVMVNRATRDRVHVTLDIEQYRERRREELTELAERLAQKAVSTGEPVVLRPMTPFERKVVHVALHENPDVETFSDGEEPYRRITIEPAG